MYKWLFPLFVAALIVTPAAADNIADCEVLLIETIVDEDMKGEAQVVTYAPATAFITSVYDDKAGHLTKVKGHPIKALLCHRNNVIPAKSDYPLLATGIPFVLSQDLDSKDTDSLTVYWKDEAFEHVYKGYPLSKESQGILTARLADFSKRGLIKNKAEPEIEPEPENKKDIDQNADAPTEIAPNIESDE